MPTMSAVYVNGLPLQEWATAHNSISRLSLSLFAPLSIPSSGSNIAMIILSSCPPISRLVKKPDFNSSKNGTYSPSPKTLA